MQKKRRVDINNGGIKNRLPSIVPAGVSHLEGGFVRSKVGSDHLAKEEVMVSFRHLFHDLYLESHGESCQQRIPAGGYCIPVPVQCLTVYNWFTKKGGHHLLLILPGEMNGSLLGLLERLVQVRPHPKGHGQEGWLN